MNTESIEIGFVFDPATSSARIVTRRRLWHNNKEGLGVDEMLWFAALAKLHSTEEVDKAGTNNHQWTSTNSIQSIIKPTRN